MGNAVAAMAALNPVASGQAPQDPAAGLALLQAVAAKDLPTLERLLHSPKQVPPLEHGGVSCLHVAAVVDFPEAVAPLLAAGSDIEAALKLSQESASALPQQLGLTDDVHCWQRLPFESSHSLRGSTPLCLALFQGSRRTAEQLLAAGAQMRAGVSRIENTAFNMPTLMTTYALPTFPGVPREKPAGGLAAAVQAAAEVLLSRGLPAGDSLLDACRTAAELAWPREDELEQQPWMLNRLLQLLLDEGQEQAQQDQPSQAGAVLHVLKAAIDNLDMTAFQEWVATPAAQGQHLLHFLAELGERLLFWQEGMPTACAEHALLLLLDKPAIRQALAQEAAEVAQRSGRRRLHWGSSTLALAACAGRARVVEGLLAAGVPITDDTLEEASPASIWQYRINIENSVDWQYLHETGLYKEATEMPDPMLGTHMLRAAQAQAWSPETHAHFPPDFRAAARTLLLVAHRGARSMAASTAPASTGRRVMRRQARRASRAAAPAAVLPGQLEREQLLAVIGQAAFPLSAWDWRSFGLAGDWYEMAQSDPDGYPY